MTKSNQLAIEDFLTKVGYQFYGKVLNLLSVHQEDPVSYTITSDLAGVKAKTNPKSSHHPYVFNNLFFRK